MKSNKEELKNIVKHQEIDRQRIANDLHDTSLQTLAHLTHQIELASLYIDKDTVRAKLELAEVNKELREVIDEIRATIFDLRPMTFDDIGLKEAIERDIANVDRVSDISYKYEIGDICIEDEFDKLIVYRIIQECIKNCEKHSKASTVNICISQDRNLRIVIKDDGVGMDINNIPGVDSNHFGYSIINDRVETLDGHMEVTSSPGGGTVVSFEIPVS